MTSLQGLIKDPAPGTTPNTGAIIETDMHNAIVDYISGENASGIGINLIMTTVVKTGSYTFTEQDQVILVNAVGGAIPVTLPDATVLGIKYKIYVVKKTDSSANAVTVGTTSSQTIDNASTFVLTQQNEVLMLQSDGTNWRIFDHYLGKRYDQLEINPVLRTSLILDLPTAPIGSASEFIGALSVPSSAIAFATTAQTNDYVTNKLGQATLTNPSSGTVPNATTLKILGAPIASTNVTITNAYALWVAAGTTKLDGAISATGLLTSTGGITMSSSDITLAGNKITSTTYSYLENGADQFLGVPNIQLLAVGTNKNSVLSLQPTGTAVRSHIEIHRVSDTTNWETLFIGSDLTAGSSFEIASYKSGTGTQRPVNIQMGSTKLLSFDTANTITTYVGLILGGTLNTVGNIIVGGSGNDLLLYAGSGSAGGGGIVAPRNNGNSNSIQFYSPNGAKTADVERLRIQGVGDSATLSILTFENFKTSGAVTFVPFTKAGSVSDSDFTTPTSGMIAVDTTNNKLWVRFGSTWKSVVLT